MCLVAFASDVACVNSRASKWARACGVLVIFHVGAMAGDGREEAHRSSGVKTTKKTPPNIVKR